MRCTMARLASVFLKFLAAATLFGVVAANVFAANLQFVGSVGRSSDYATFAILTIDQIHNYDATGNSANLRVEFWASVQPFSGSYTSAYRLCKYDVGSLAAGASTPRLTPFVQPFTVPPNGTYYLAMVLTEYTGGTANDGYAIRHYLKFPDSDTHQFGPPPPDTTPPTVSIASPTGGNVSGTITISANASDNIGINRVDFYVNGKYIGADATAPFQFTWNTTTAANGAATIYAKAFDAQGNTAQSATVTVNVSNGSSDTTPPTVSISSPTGGNVSGTVTISANASDNVGVARVDFYVKGVLVGSDATAPFQYAWNTTVLANGSATLYAKAFDAAGNSTQSATVTVNVSNAPPPDTTPPTVSITSPTGGNVSGTVIVSATASDNVGVAKVDFYVNGALVGSDAAAPFQYAWNTTALANGSATLYAKAFDAAGNSKQSATVTVNVTNGVPDTTPPTVSITSPTGGNVSGIVTVSATASDNVGVARVDFYVNGKFLSSREEFHTGGTLLGSDATAPYQLSWSTAALANGTATLYAKAFDAAGNSTQSSIVTIDVANIAIPPSAGPITSFAIEYYNALLDHYFVSASATDINMLDSGSFVGWSRTGYAFKVYAQPSGTANPVCRFYLPPAFGDSHFYSASPDECANVSDRFPLFVRESSDVFYADLPDPDTGACPASMTPVYRMWNGRSDANHRYVTDPSLRDQLVMKGYIAEGYGPNAVSMCAPM